MLGVPVCVKGLGKHWSARIFLKFLFYITAEKHETGRIFALGVRFLMTDNEVADAYACEVYIF